MSQNQDTPEDRLKTVATSAAESSDVLESDFDDDRTGQEGTAYTLEERRRMMRSEWDTNLLPEPPKEPGWHYCWLSTTSSTDPIYRRIQRGYELVRSEHLKGWNQLRVSQGEYEGFVGCNEMILSRIPEELYQEAMRYFHHELPLAEEGRIREQALEERQVQDSKGHDLITGEGRFNRLQRVAALPKF